MQVRVKSGMMGFYDLKRRRAGDVFSLKDPALFSHRWMETADGSEPPPKRPKPVKLDASAAGLEIARLRAELAELKAVKASEDEKRGPGRPPKTL